MDEKERLVYTHTHTHTHTPHWNIIQAEKKNEEITFTATWMKLSSVQSFSHVLLFVTPWSAPHQASLFITNSQSLLKLMSIESVMTSSHLILCHPLLPSIFPSIRGFSKVSSSLQMAKVVLEFQL